MIASGTGTMALFAARHFALKNLNAPGGISGTETEPLAAQHGQNTNGTNAIEYGTIDVEVVAVPCVSSSLHLLDQMRILDLESGSHDIFPTVLRTHRDLQPHSEAGASMNVARNEATKSESVGSSEGVFGEPCKAHYVIWEDLKSAMGMDFDLIYAPRAFELLLESFQHDVEMWRDCNILYYHCGGMEGNESQLGRYRYKNIIER